MADSAEVVQRDDLKTMLQLDTDKMDSTLDLIIENTVAQARFKLHLQPEEAFPKVLTYIPMEVCVRRYNRLKNEGMASYSQEGESITFNSNDFDDFMDDINEWLKAREDTSLGQAVFMNPYKGTWTS